MKNLLHPKWILIVNTLPLVILFILLWGEYGVLKTELSEEAMLLWQKFAIAIGVFGVLNILYAVCLIFWHQKVTLPFAVAEIVCCISVIYLNWFNMDEMIPQLPMWMISGDLPMYITTALMPTLAYALFVMVVCLTPDDRPHRAWINFVGALIIPLSAFIFVSVIAPMLKDGPEGEFNVHVTIITYVILLMSFLFFVVRGIYILVQKKASLWKRYRWIFDTLVALILPLTGLLVNNSWYPLFGDFSDVWFYVLAIVNGLLVLIPEHYVTRRWQRLLLFAGRCITFSYTLYFFLIFLPYLPLFFLLIIAFGLGFLVLCPLFLFVVHVGKLCDDFAVLKKNIASKKLIAIAMLGFCFIPLVITINYKYDRHVLNAGMAYFYMPDYAEEYHLDENAFLKIIDKIKNNDTRANSIRIMNSDPNHIPFLSSYFNWIVLDNLTISDAKMDLMTQVLAGNPLDSESPVEDEPALRDSILITNIHSKSTYDPKQNVWISQVDLELKNESEDGWQNEYQTSFKLPVGCWISDYYLYVGDRKEQGILAEKKSAMWIYSRIHEVERDPGILFYQAGNRVSFHVFPFLSGETRRTGIEFIHKEPVTLVLDGQSVFLGDSLKRPVQLSTQIGMGIKYVSAAQKKTLPLVQRTPYYHFIMDASIEATKGSETESPVLSNSYVSQITSLLQKKLIPAENAQISFVGKDIKTMPIDMAGAWKQPEDKYVGGGFFLDRALKKIWFDSYRNNKNSYPVIVVISPHTINSAIMMGDLADWQIACPEGLLVYCLNTTGELSAYTVGENGKFREMANADLLLQNGTSVRAYPDEKFATAYLPDNGESDIVLPLEKKHYSFDDADIHSKEWKSALLMQGEYLTQVLYPGTSNKSWLKMVRGSFRAGIMMPVTSYIVVETEAQKALLMRKQEQVLSGSKMLDADTENMRMSEPQFWLVAILFGLFIWWRRKRGVPFSKR